MIHLCMRAAKAMASQCIYSGSHKYSFLEYAISTKFLCAGSYVVNTGLDQYDDVHDIVNFVLITFSVVKCIGVFLRCWHTQRIDVDK